MHFSEVGRGESYRDTHQILNQQNITLHLINNKYTTQASCFDGKINLGPKNSVHEHVWLCISITRPDNGLLFALLFFILYFLHSYFLNVTVLVLCVLKKVLIHSYVFIWLYLIDSVPPV